MMVAAPASDQMMADELTSGRRRLANRLMARAMS